MCVCVCWTFTLPVLVLDIGLYFTLEHYSYLWRVCVCACTLGQVCVCACVRSCAFGCCFVSANGLLVDVCQCCCLLMFVCLPLSKHFPYCKTWWIKNLNGQQIKSIINWEMQSSVILGWTKYVAKTKMHIKEALYFPGVVTTHVI